MKENGSCMTGMHAAYAFLLGHVLYLRSTCHAERPPCFLVNVVDLHSKSTMQPLCIGGADSTCTEVRVAGARAICASSKSQGSQT